MNDIDQLRREAMKYGRHKITLPKGVEPTEAQLAIYQGWKKSDLTNQWTAYFSGKTNIDPFPA